MDRNILARHLRYYRNRLTYKQDAQSAIRYLRKLKPNKKGAETN